MKEIIQALEQIERTARRSDAAKIESAIQSARRSLAGAEDEKLRQLDAELSTWQKKSNVILKEPVGREGISKHARHWMEELRKMNVG